ncbi:MAG: pdr1 [Actinomycetia bacterium]|nr:pdr1 [Actinomycetes bacterium]
MSAVLVQNWWMTHRRLKALVRQPAVVGMMLMQPAIWLFLFGGLFKNIVELPGFAGQSYLGYLVPGVVVMSAVSSNMWAGMSVIEEIDRGTLNRFLVTPVSRGAIMNAGVIEQAVSTAVQSVLIIVLGWIGGAHYTGGVTGLAALVLASVLLGAVFSALSNTMGLLVRQREMIIGLSVALLLPLTFLSSAFMPTALMPGWIRHVAAFNPVNWSLEAARAGLLAKPDWTNLAVHGGWLLALAALMVWLATYSFRAYQKSI